MHKVIKATFYYASMSNAITSPNLVMHLHVMVMHLGDDQTFFTPLIEFWFKLTESDHVIYINRNQDTKIISNLFVCYRWIASNYVFIADIFVDSLKKFALQQKYNTFFFLLIHFEHNAKHQQRFIPNFLSTLTLTTTITTARLRRQRQEHWRRQQWRQWCY